jgi:hypothetical protein
LQICYYRTTKVVRVGDELLWNFPPVQNYKYTKFDVKKPLLSFSSQTDDSILDVPIPKPIKVPKATPVTAKKRQPPVKKNASAVVVSHSNQPALVRVAENPYGASAAHDGQANANQDDSDNVSISHAGSGSSPESSDNDQDHVVQPQPVYEDFQFPILDKKRKITFDWEVKNEVASNIAPSLFMGTTKLHWRAIGLAGLARRKTELECFMLMDVPISTGTVHGPSILKMTNDSIKAAKSKRGGDLTKSVDLIHHHHHYIPLAPLPPCFRFTIATTTSPQLLRVTSQCDM